jgi:hypothetical protein
MDCFVGMPLELLKSMNSHPQIEAHSGNIADEEVLPDDTLDFDMDTNDTNSIPDPDMNVVELEDKATLDATIPINDQVKSAQENHYDLLKEWLKPHGLCIDHQNYFWKDASLVVVEDHSLRRGVTHHFHSPRTAGHPGILNTLALIWPHF